MDYDQVKKHWDHWATEFGTSLRATTKSQTIMPLGMEYGRSKGKATRGLVDGSLWIDVDHRPLAEYEQCAQ
jgi:hypothetical protein